MSYIVARGYGRSLANHSYELRIINTGTGTDTNKEFALDPLGFELAYESEEDTLLVPGFMHSRCTVNTIWSSDEFVTLESLISDLGASQDGDFLLHVFKESETLWVGSILVEEFTVSEDSAQRSVRFVATDAISMLRNVDYSDDGTAYTGYQTIETILKNIQEKWVLWDYFSEQFTGAQTARIAVVEDVYSEDDYVMSPLVHPAGSNRNTLRRTRVHTNPWSKLNDAGDTEFISCYDLLHSLCLTYQFRLYSYQSAWYFIPCSLGSTQSTGYYYPYTGTTIQDITLPSTWSFNLGGATPRQKGNEWVRTFTPQTKQISLTRDPNDGATILSGINIDNNTTMTAANLVYAGIDTEPDEVRYVVRGRLLVSATAITIDDNEDLARLQQSFQIRWDPTGVSEYYRNTLVRMYDGSIAVAQFLDGENLNYNVMSAYGPEYSASAGDFFLPQNEEHFYTPSEGMSRAIDFEFSIPPPQTAKTGLTVRPKVQAYNRTGQESATLQNALTINFLQVVIEKWSGDELELIDNFDFVASSTAGQNKHHLGTTYVGGLGASMGRLEVQTAQNVYGSTDNWVTQSSDDARPINQLCVEEILAGHTRARVLERGASVVRGSTVMPAPFARFFNPSDGNAYTALNYKLQATPCEVDVTLRKTGRNPISITTDYANTGRIPGVPPTDVVQGDVKPKPQIMYGYNNLARTNFGLDWSSVIGGTETKEMYYTVANDGQGRFIDYQGDTPQLNYAIVRKVYVVSKGLQEPTDSGWSAPAALQPDNNDDLEDCITLMQNYMNKLNDRPSYTFMVTYDEVSTTPLIDEYTGATAAYGLRKLRAAYGGNCLQVRRGNSATTQTIGFTSQGELDTAALETFANGESVFVVTWYDQTGNNNHCIQTATASQPKICDAGTTITLNGLPAMELDGSNDSLTTAASFNANANTNELIVAWVGSVTNLTAGNNMVSHWNSSTANQVFQVQMTASNDNLRWTHRYSNGSIATADNGSAITSGDQYIVVGHTRKNKHEAYYEGNKVTGTAQNVNPNDASTSFRIGARSDNQAGPHQGKTQEVVIWSRTTAANDADDIETTLNQRFNAF